MGKLIAIFLFFFGSSGCIKEDISKPYGFLHLRVGDNEEVIWWESIKVNWNDSLGSAYLEATSYFFDECRIQLKNIQGNGIITTLTLNQFYYTDGIDFRPFDVSGIFIINQADRNAIKGSFDVVFKNTFNGEGSKRITGNFGIINSQ